MPRWGLTGGFQFGILPELGAVSTGIHLFIFSFDRWFGGVRLGKGSVPDVL